MNIFVLDRCPDQSARWQCDKHVVKMVLESAQLLSTAHHVIDEPTDAPIYKIAHRNHPCAIWARRSVQNYTWLRDHYVALADEYQRRYNKQHKSASGDLFDYLYDPPDNCPSLGFNLQPLCTGDMTTTHSDPVIVYRLYYAWKETRIQMSWRPPSQRPYWLPPSLESVLER